MKLGRKRFLLLYTVLFAGLSLVVWFPFLRSGKTLVQDSDAYIQHFMATRYFAGYYRDVLRNLFTKGRLLLPQWDFAIGEGADVRQTLQYYGFTDPFMLPAVLFPAEKLILYFHAMIFARQYAAGLSFAFLCRETGVKNRAGILAGALSAAFSSYMINYAITQQTFLAAMVCMPLLIAGTERVFRGKYNAGGRPYLLVFSVFLTAVSSIYFLYVCGLLCLIYVFLRMVFLYAGGQEQRRKCLGALRILAPYTMLGLCLGAFSVFPAAYGILSSSRLSDQARFHWIYNIHYYSKLPSVMISAEGVDFLFLGFALPAWFSVFILFFKRQDSRGPDGKRRFLRALFLICAMFALFPVFGRILNGFSYESNRWCFTFVLVTAYIFAEEWENVTALAGRKALLAAVVSAAAGIVFCILEKADRPDLWLLFLIMAVFCFTLRSGGSRAEILVLSAVLLNLALNGYFLTRWINTLSSSRIVSEINNNEAAAVREAAAAEKAGGETGVLRYSGEGMRYNIGMAEGVSSTSYYWSVMNPKIRDFRSAFAFPDMLFWRVEGYDGSAILNSLAGVRYYALPRGPEYRAPFGYSLLPDVKGYRYSILENDFALPAMYLYGKVVPESEWKKLDIVRKEEAMMQGAVLPDDAVRAAESAGIPAVRTAGDGLSFASVSLPYEIAGGDGITAGEGFFRAEKPGASAEILFNAPAGGETRICFSGFSFSRPGMDTLLEAQGGLWINIQIRRMEKNAAEQAGSGENGASRIFYGFRYPTEDHSYYYGQHDYSVSLRYSEGEVTGARLTFGEPGEYSFDGLSVLFLPMTGYPAQAEALRGSAAGKIRTGSDPSGDFIRADVSPEETGVLCLAFPWAEGWKAYDGGQESALYPVNIRHMGLILEKGEHEITLIYRSPYLREGRILSAAALLILLLSAAADCFSAGKRKV